MVKREVEIGYTFLPFAYSGDRKGTEELQGLMLLCWVNLLCGWLCIFLYRFHDSQSMI